MNRTGWMTAIICAFCFITGTSEAGVLFQTQENPDHSHCCGSASIFSGNYSSLGNPQWIGARFTLDNYAHIDGIGADFDYVEGTIFGAIVSLDAADALPEGNPFTTSNVEAEITIGGGAPICSINLNLAPGN